ncbi:hypothetical protein P3T21_005475 [Paraburkholderia sp. GAS334]
MAFVAFRSIGWGLMRPVVRRASDAVHLHVLGENLYHQVPVHIRYPSQTSCISCIFGEKSLPMKLILRLLRIVFLSSPKSMRLKKGGSVEPRVLPANRESTCLVPRGG